MHSVYKNRPFMQKVAKNYGNNLAYIHIIA